MAIERAIWFPFWYELDQSIAVGQSGEFHFFKVVPHYIAHDGLRLFYHGDWQDRCRHLFDRRRAKILRIQHPILGSIRSIDTSGLTYTFKMSDGRCEKVEAEETPGIVYGRDKPITDWRVFVEMLADTAL